MVVVDQQAFGADPDIATRAAGYQQAEERLRRAAAQQFGLAAGAGSARPLACLLIRWPDARHLAGRPAGQPDAGQRPPGAGVAGPERLPVIADPEGELRRREVVIAAV